MNDSSPSLALWQDVAKPKEAEDTLNQAELVVRKQRLERGLDFDKLSTDDFMNMAQSQDPHFFGISVMRRRIKKGTIPWGLSFWSPLTASAAACRVGCSMA